MVEFQMDHIQEYVDIYLNNIGRITIGVGLFVAIGQVVFYAVKRMSSWHNFENDSWRWYSDRFGFGLVCV
jgi:hypothetical protein